MSITIDRKNSLITMPLMPGVITLDYNDSKKSYSVSYTPLQKKEEFVKIVDYSSEEDDTSDAVKSGDNDDDTLIDVPIIKKSPTKTSISTRTSQDGITTTSSINKEQVKSKLSIDSTNSMFDVDTSCASMFSPTTFRPSGFSPIAQSRTFSPLMGLSAKPVDVKNSNPISNINTKTNISNTLSPRPPIIEANHYHSKKRPILSLSTLDKVKESGKKYRFRMGM
jgi:hypothetical protein